MNIWTRNVSPKDTILSFCDLNSEEPQHGTAGNLLSPASCRLFCGRVAQAMSCRHAAEDS